MPEIGLHNFAPKARSQNTLRIRRAERSLQKPPCISGGGIDFGNPGFVAPDNAGAQNGVTA